MQQWRAAASNVPATLATPTDPRCDYIDFIAAKAAQWGADQELESCCEWLSELPQQGEWFANELRSARRPKPPSLKDRALQLVDLIGNKKQAANSGDWDTIRRALEQLSDD